MSGTPDQLQAPVRVQNGRMPAETVALEVVGPDTRETRTFNATSYTVHADGGLDVAPADGSVVNFAGEEWADVRSGRGEGSPGRQDTGE